MTRTVVWFSAGAPSAVCAKVMTATNDHVVVAYIDPGSEHEDNVRFVDDVERWIGHPVQRLRSDRYEDTWSVWEKRRFLVGPVGALCTTEMKKMVRVKFERPTDVQVFGFTVEEQDRADRFREQNPGVTLATPLIDRGLKKEDCQAIIDRAGIVLPAMYRLGYRNNNCIGCVKGGMGYWNKIRVTHPEVFARMALLEREIGHSILSDKDGPVWLDELDPERGDYPSELAADCSILCALTEMEVA